MDYRPHNRTQKARQRIARLENLVTELRDRTVNPSQNLDDTPLLSNDLVRSEPPLTIPSTTGSMGNLNLTEERSVYTGSSHWATILEDVSLAISAGDFLLTGFQIQQLKDDLSDDFSESVDGASPPFDSFSHQPSAPRIFLLSSVTCFSTEQILAMLPPRRRVDRYISQYFNTFDSSRPSLSTF